MRTEASVPPQDRVLVLAARLTERRFEEERLKAINWCRENPTRLSESNLVALEALREVKLNETVFAFVTDSCYADIPKNRTYTVLFDCSLPSKGETTNAQLSLGIFWRQVPTEGLEHGHHQVAVFEFPKGVPPLLASLPLCDNSQVNTDRRFGLCDLSDWKAISAVQPDA